MSITGGKIKKLVRRFIAASPSLFDIGVITFILLIAFWRNGFQKNFIFFLGTMALYGISLRDRPRRVYHSLPLAWFLIWSLTNIWLHAWDAKLLQSVTTSMYLNVCILGESFLYIFTSIMLIKLIVAYSRDYRYYYPTLIIAFIPWARRLVHQGSMTMMLSVASAFVIYWFLNRKWKFSLLSILIGANIVAWNWKWVWFKFYPRPLVWKMLWDEFMMHPWIGQGYWRTLDFNKADMIWVKYDLYGPMFRHNDYINAGVYLGVLMMILIGWFIIRTIKDIYKHPACIVFLAAVIIPFFQMTMFELYKAAFIIVVVATALAKGYDDKNTKISAL